MCLQENRKTEKTMPASIVRLLLTLTELGMLGYWVFATLVILGVLSVAPEAMYPDHTNPTVVAWNWSFLPLDVLFAIAGLASRYIRMSPQRAGVLAVVSLALMFSAGLMALSFWSIEGFFDPLWWGMNGWLVALPIVAIVVRFD